MSRQVEGHGRGQARGRAARAKGHGLGWTRVRSSCAVDFTGLRKSIFKCDGRSQVPVLGRQNGWLCTVAFKNCYNQRRADGEQKQWRRWLKEKRLRGRLAVGLGSLGFERRIMETYAGKKMYANDLLEEARQHWVLEKSGHMIRHSKLSFILSHEPPT